MRNRLTTSNKEDNLTHSLSRSRLRGSRGTCQTCLKYQNENHTTGLFVIFAISSVQYFLHNWIGHPHPIKNKIFYFQHICCTVDVAKDVVDSAVCQHFTRRASHKRDASLPPANAQRWIARDII